MSASVLCASRVCEASIHDGTAPPSQLLVDALTVKSGKSLDSYTLHHAKSCLWECLSKVPVHIEQLVAAAEVVFPSELASLWTIAKGGPLEWPVAEDCQLFFHLMAEVPWRDLRVEDALTEIRRRVCALVGHEALREVWHDRNTRCLLSSLACQCHITGYLYDQAPGEANALSDMRFDPQGIASTLPEITVYAMYNPLSLHPNAELLKAYSPQCSAMRQLWRSQLEEPGREYELMRAIEDASASLPTNSISLAVKNIFTLHPYPVWASVPQRPPIAVNRYIKDELGGEPGSTSECPDILCAGGGTCKEAIDHVFTIKGSRVLVVDLSAHSLAKGWRKAEQFGVRDRMEFLQADILQFVASTDRHFDIISSGGVLHYDNLYHSAIAMLRKLLRRGGVLRLAVYSRLARRDVEEARAFVQANRYTTSYEDIRRLREELKVLALQGRSFARKVIRRTSFHTSSEFVDLLFVNGDIARDLPDVADKLEEAGLSILSVELEPFWEPKYQAFSSGVDPFNRDIKKLWEFEQGNPHMAGSMYIISAQTALTNI